MVIRNVTELNHRTFKHILWIPINAILAFGLPYVAVSIMKISSDFYFGLVVILSAGLMVYYSKATQFHWKSSLKTGWALGTIIGIFFGLGILSISSISQPGIETNFFRLSALPLIWRGLVYGLALAILISVFPFIVIWRALAGASPRSFRKTYVTLAAIAAIFLMTVLYNLGMSGGGPNFQDRIEKNLIASIPTIISGSPLASPITIMFLQVSEAAKTLHANNQISLQNKQSLKPKTVPGGIN
jgi:hypothetical protein